MMMLALLAAAALQAAPVPYDARVLSLAAPQTVASIDTGKLKGDLQMLAWSPDGQSLYVQTVERGRGGAVKAMHHYVLSLESKQFKDTGEAPAWAVKYWTWKAGQASPAESAFRINVDQRQEVVSATSTPRGGDLARGGADTGAGPGGSGGSTSVVDAAGAAYQSQNQTIFTLKVKGETIGEWVNEAVTPGSNFTWAPQPMNFFAFAKRDGGPLFVIDAEGHRKEWSGAKSAVLPAWSDDGKRIAWLEKRDKKHFDVTIADVSMK